MTALVQPAVEVDRVTSAADLEALGGEWAELWRRCPDATPFQSPQWLVPWWNHFAGAGLCARAVRRRGRLVGLAPVFTWANPEAGERQMLLLGTGITDVAGGLFAPEARGEALAAVFTDVAHEADSWDACDFQQLRPGDPLLEAPLGQGWEEQRTVQDVCPVLPLPDCVNRLGEVVPPRQLEKLRYYRRRAEREGGLRVERASEGTFSELFAALLRLHAARWEKAGRPGVLADDRVQCFHREAAAGLLRAGALRVYGLHVGDRLAACYYGFLAHGRAYFYLAGFDPGLGHLSPGMLVVGHAIEEAVREGACEFDFLRGAEPYKYHWGAADRPNARRVLRREGGTS